MLESVFGNPTAERVLMFIHHYGEGHLGAIAADSGISKSAVRQQLSRFERGGILVSKEMGRTRIYTFNKKSPLTRPVQELVAMAYNSLSIPEKEAIFHQRRRPRRQGKPVR